jgi:hypothetical protein
VTEKVEATGAQASRLLFRVLLLSGKRNACAPIGGGITS